MTIEDKTKGEKLKLNVVAKESCFVKDQACMQKQLFFKRQIYLLYNMQTEIK